jgi:hypothetical protein
MADERYCRYATKLTVAGVTLIDGVLSVSALDIMINRVMFENDAPMIILRGLYDKPVGFHMHYDIVVNGQLIAFEITAVSDPVSATPRPSEPELV